MNTSQIITNPELGEEAFMEADRSFFKNNPDKVFYLRERFNDELMPDSPPYVVVFNFGEGIRFRIPYHKSAVSDEDVKQLQKEYKKEFKAMEQFKSKKEYKKELKAIEKLKSNSKAKLRLRKSKGFGKK
ncbi:MAG: hypothetical protein QNJ65_05170 [Xenococcaceae cyanobacterium MO_234.B1]|nr:hypothetical protein [Xenococcaceae cyanobacterium MO_234.B1]